MSGIEDGATPGTARAIKDLLRPEMRRRRSALDRLTGSLASPGGAVALALLNAAGVALWAAVGFGLLPGVPAPDPDPLRPLSVLLPLEAVLLCALVLARQGRAEERAEARARLGSRAALLLEAEVTEALQQLARINARLGIEPDGVGPDRRPRRLGPGR